MSCTPVDRYAGCNFKRTRRLDSCHEPGGCLAGQETHQQALERIDATAAADRHKLLALYAPEAGGLSADEEAKLATFIARPEWRRVKPLLAKVLGVDLAPLDDVVARVRRELWRDFSTAD